MATNPLKSSILDQGACRELSDPDVMYPDDKAYRYIAEAKKVCAGCPIRTQCLEIALERNEQWGVWGGLTTDERNALTKGKVRLAS